MHIELKFTSQHCESKKTTIEIGSQPTRPVLPKNLFNHESYKYTFPFFPQENIDTSNFLQHVPVLTKNIGFN